MGAGRRAGEAASYYGKLLKTAMSLGDSLGSCSSGCFVSTCGVRGGGVCYKSDFQDCTLEYWVVTLGVRSCNLLCHKSTGLGNSWPQSKINLSQAPSFTTEKTDMPPCGGGTGLLGKRYPLLGFSWLWAGGGWIFSALR